MGIANLLIHKDKKGEKNVNSETKFPLEKPSFSSYIIGILTYFNETLGFYRII